MLFKEGVVPGNGNFMLVGDLESAFTFLLNITQSGQMLL